MKKYILYSIIFLSNFTIYSQQQYYVYSYQKKFGLTDSLSSEVIQPIYRRYRISKNKKQYLFDPEFSSDEPLVFFNAKNGVIDIKYKNIYLDVLVIDNQSYHLLQSKNNAFLQNSETEVLTELDKGIHMVDNLGGTYLIAKSFLMQKESTNRKILNKDKNSAPLPEVIKEPIFVNSFHIYKNNLSLKEILTIEADSYLPLYEKIEVDGKYLKNMEQFNSTNFDYILFKRKKILYLYDKNLKLIKEINYPNENNEFDVNKDFAITQTSKIVNKNLYSTFPVYPSMFDNNSVIDQVEFKVAKSEENSYQLIRNNDSKVSFSTPYKLEYYFYNTLHKVYVENKLHLVSECIIDKKTGLPYLPKKYIDLLKIEITQ